MKAIIPIISILLLCSCSRYLQIIQIQGKENISTKEDKLTYEDSNCKISYNFWYEGGLSGFEFHNKTDQMIKIDLSECFFIKNGYAYDYFQDRKFIVQQSSGSSISSMFMNNQSKGKCSSSTTFPVGFVGLPYKTKHEGKLSQEANSYGTSYTTYQGKSVGVETVEQKIISIPPHTTKLIKGFIITPSIYRNCDLLLVPYQKDNKLNARVSSLKFSSNDSPLNFSNHVKYYVGEQKTGHSVKNNFYMGEVKNMNYKDATRSIYPEWCGVKQGKIKVVKDASANKFYLQYKINPRKAMKH